ncbi:MAG TPA: VWA domain-containing protein [Anaerolineae bacterium]
MRKTITAFALAFALGLLANTGAHAQGPINIAVTQVDTSQFPQVQVYVSVTDAAGNPVRNADPKTFQLQENGQAMQLVAATRSGDQGPVSTVLVVDRTGSMASADKMAGARQAAATFVNLMRPGDRTALVQFDTEIETLLPLTDDKSALLASIQKIFPRGNTALYDAIAKAGAYFENVQGRKAVIVVTDGMDNASKLNRDALLKQAGTAGYSIYTIGLGAKGAGYGSQDGIDESGLQDIAAASYGTYAYAPDASQLSGLYQQLSLKIQNEYRLSYLTPTALRDGVKRNIVVTAPGAAAAQTAYNPGGIIPEVAPQWEAWLLFFVALVLLLGLFFAPLAVRVARERGLAIPTLPDRQPARPSRVRLTGAAPATNAAGMTAASTPAARPSRIKIKRPAAVPTSDRSQMPWDEGASKH